VSRLKASDFRNIKLIVMQSRYTVMIIVCMMIDGIGKICCWRMTASLREASQHGIISMFHIPPELADCQCCPLDRVPLDRLVFLTDYLSLCGRSDLRRKYLHTRVPTPVELEFQQEPNNTN